MSTIRRMPSRFLDGAPPNVVDIFYQPEYTDCYTVFTTSVYDGWVDSFDSNSDASFSGWSEHKCWVLRQYRDRARKYRLAWMDLPKAIRDIVVEDTLVP